MLLVTHEMMMTHKHDESNTKQDEINTKRDDNKTKHDGDNTKHGDDCTQYDADTTQHDCDKTDMTVTTHKMMCPPVGLWTAPHACHSLCCSVGESKAGLAQKRTRSSSSEPRPFVEELVTTVAFCPRTALTASLTEAPVPALPRCS